jgi:hypothetical protein
MAVGDSAEHVFVEPEALDYPEVLARLTAMIGRQVEGVTARGVGSKATILPAVLGRHGVAVEGDVRRASGRDRALSLPIRATCPMLALGFANRCS